MNSRARETLYGTLTVGLLAALLTFNVLERHETAVVQNGLVTLTATFNRVDGLAQGASVRMAGVPVGVVDEMRLTDRFGAQAVLKVREDVPLPDDTAAIIETEGLFGSKYIELQPGGSLDNLQPGDTIRFTQDSVILEELLSKIIARAKAARGVSADQPVDGGNGADATGAGGGGNPFPSLSD
ncbi:MlaD family protein [Caenispirillum salinarum]|uniref:MlaD family protein n=1 Tax=Caenispirillum salinarum TaxID=859058 RepID=UPI00384C76AF